MRGARLVLVPGVALLFAGTFADAALASPWPQDQRVVLPQDTPVQEVLSAHAGINLVGVPLHHALRTLQAAGVKIAYSPSLLPQNTVVTCRCLDIPLEEAVSRLLEGSSLDFRVVGNQLLIRPAAGPVFRGVASELPRIPPISYVPISRQDTVVSGTVVEARSRRPLVGARVLIVETGAETLTDGRGHFRLRGVTGSVTLRAIALGYSTTSLSVAAGTEGLEVALTESPIALDAMVVTGTPGAVQRRSIANSVGRLDVADAMEVAPVSDVGDLLQGRSAGLTVSPASGAVGGGQRITIRGRSSMSLGGQPLIYIDGIRVANDPSTGPSLGIAQPISRLGDINPADIERIEIIKGPAAATLYGTEASNGVIHIITKTGGGGGRAVMEARMRQGVQWFADQEGRIGSTWGADPASGEIIEFNIVRSERNAGREIWTAGHLQGYGTSVRGSTNDLNYFVSLDYDQASGVEPTNRLRRLSTRANLQLAVHPALDVTANFGVVRSRVDLAPELNVAVMPSAVFALPALRDTPSRGFFLGPPEVLWDVYDNVFQTVGRTTNGLGLEHRLGTWLTQRLRVGLDLTSENNQVIIERMSDDHAPFFSQVVARGQKNMTLRNLMLTTADYSGTAMVNLRPELASSTSVGLQYYRRFAEFANVVGQEFPAPNLTTTAAAATTFGNDDFIENTTVGVFVQQQFSWNDRLFLTGAIRADDNSAFGADFEFVTYPKLGATWVISEERFWNVVQVDALRLRAAYGQSGQQPETFAALRTYRPITGPGDRAAVSPGFVGNPDLSPERGVEYELGGDAEFFGGRLGIDLTYYRQTTKDAILRADVPPSLGFPGQQFLNAGSVRNSGIELAVEAVPITTRQVNVDLSVNVATNKNRILDLGDREFIASGQARHAVGYPIGSFFGRRVVSADAGTGGAPVNVLCDGGPGSADPVPCGQAPEVLLGSPGPKMEGAITIGATIRQRLRLHTMVDFKRSYHMWDVNTWARCAAFQACEINFYPERFDPVDVAQLQVAGGGPSPFITDASFTKLREIAATYTFPSSWAQRVSASRARITVAGRNLFTWAPHWVGMDPETVATSAIDTEAYQQALMPQLTQITTSITVTF